MSSIHHQQRVDSAVTRVPAGVQQAGEVAASGLSQLSIPNSSRDERLSDALAELHPAVALHLPDSEVKRPPPSEEPQAPMLDVSHLELCVRSMKAQKTKNELMAHALTFNVEAAASLAKRYRPDIYRQFKHLQVLVEKCGKGSLTEPQRVELAERLDDSSAALGQPLPNGLNSWKPMLSQQGGNFDLREAIRWTQFELLHPVIVELASAAQEHSPGLPSAKPSTSTKLKRWAFRPKPVSDTEHSLIHRCAEFERRHPTATQARRTQLIDTANYQPDANELRREMEHLLITTCAFPQRADLRLCDALLERSGEVLQKIEGREALIRDISFFANLQFSTSANPVTLLLGIRKGLLDSAVSSYLKNGPPNAYREARADEHWTPPIVLSEEPNTVLGKGACNSVHLATVRLPDGTELQGVYKADSRHLPRHAEAAGIRPPLNWNRRNVATWNLNVALGLRVITPTRRVISPWGLGCIMELARGSSPRMTAPQTLQVDARTASALRQRPDLLESFAKSRGYLSAKVAGQTITFELAERVKRVTELDYNNPSLRRELTRLQWLDALTGQCDRHLGNYFVHINEQGKAEVTGIDNDWGFGTTVKDPDQQQVAYSSRLPRVIDRELADKFHAMMPEDLDRKMEGLSELEKVVTQSRLKAIKNKLESGGCLIVENDADWSSDEVTERLGMVPTLDGLSRDEMKDALTQARLTSYVAGAAARQLAAKTPGYYRDLVMSVRPDDLVALATSSNRQPVTP